MLTASIWKGSSFGFTATLLFALGTTACVGGSARGTPLFANNGVQREPTEVARLYGEVAAVDGKSVAGLGQSFELLPGCHVVATRTSWGARDESGAMSTNLPKLEFAIHMQADKSYVIEYDLVSRNGSGGMLAVLAHEKDATGQITASLQPAASKGELERCRPADSNNPAPRG